MGWPLRALIFFHLLFTPYGYKFESGDDTSGIIYEQYSVSDVRWAIKDPWKLVKIGCADPDSGEINQLEGNGRYWSKTSAHTRLSIARLSFAAKVDDRFRPAEYYVAVWGGNSVHKVSNLLFTPYGYKFEGKLGDGRIHEEYRNTGVRRAEQKPWIFVRNGYIDLRNDTNLSNFGNDNEFWSNTAGLAASNQYFVTTSFSSLYPASYWNRFFGYSVHRRFLPHRHI